MSPAETGTTPRLPGSAMAAVGPNQQALRRTRHQRLRLALALLLSTLFHALLLSLTLFGDEFGLPGLAFPWQVRRIEVPNLQVVLAPAPVIRPEPASPPEPPPLPQPLPEASNEQPAATGELVVIFKVPEITPEPAPAPPAPATESRSAPTAKATSRPADATRKELVQASPVELPPPKPFPAVIALEQSQKTDFVVPAAPPEPPPVQSTTSAHADGETQSEIEPPAPEPVVEKTTPTESVRQEAERQESARQAAAKEEATRAEAARREAEQRENARQAATWPSSRSTTRTTTTTTTRPTAATGSCSASTATTRNIPATWTRR